MHRNFDSSIPFNEVIKTKEGPSISYEYNVAMQSNQSRANRELVISIVFSAATTSFPAFKIPSSQDTMVSKVFSKASISRLRMIIGNLGRSVSRYRRCACLGDH